MTIIGHVQDGRIVFEPPVVLPEGAQVRVEIVDEQREDAGTAAGVPSLAEKLLKYAGQAEGLPADFARRHDHYVRGIHDE